jgi:hypothetical protein
MMVPIDASLNLVERFGFTAATIDLGQTGYPRFYFVADHVAASQFSILLIVRSGMRSWSYE